MNSLAFIDHSVVDLSVKISFLRMDQQPIYLPSKFLSQYQIEKYKFISISLYRYVYNHVGYAHCWWMRKIISDFELENYLNHPSIEVYFLKDQDNRISGFFELDCRLTHNVNISYFGLMPRLIGKGIGRSFLNEALYYAWSKKPDSVRINTCEFDHPRALPLYQQAGFKIISILTERWKIPRSLNLLFPKKI